ncbi:UNVERIFIED_ORG: hypothetical protein J3D58_001288 [Paenarthrobacter nicotinovorans]|uniref:Uncharacterized protein n=1 Tax=Paenarthrobacter histidinolovorans TaxID=43664 RepID=A0ABW8N5C1_9MICC
MLVKIVSLFEQSLFEHSLFEHRPLVGSDPGMMPTPRPGT